MSDQHRTNQPCRTEVCAWVACHAGELAALGTPAVLVYQGWTYWVFRKRIGAHHIPPVHAP